MNEFDLAACFVGLISSALLILLASLNKNRLLLSAILVVGVSVAYICWGGWFEWRQFLTEQARLKEAKTLLAQSSADEIAVKLKAKLDDSPASAQGWYLLGRVYASQNNWSLAREAYAKSLSLQPDNELVSVHYIESLWQLNQQQFDAEIRGLLKNLLIKNPNQPDALALLAMDAYQQSHFKEAENYWQTLLKHLQPASKEAKAIRRAIAKARQKQEA